MRKHIHIIATEFVQTVLGVYFILIFVELAKPGMIRSIFNPDILLWFLAVGGLLALLTSRYKPSEYESFHLRDFYFVYSINTILGLLVYAQTAWLGVGAIILAIFTSAFGLLLSYLTFQQERG